MPYHKPAYVPPKSVKSIKRKKERRTRRRKYVLSMASYACECHHVWWGKLPRPIEITRTFEKPKHCYVLLWFLYWVLTTIVMPLSLKIWYACIDCACLWCSLLVTRPASSCYPANNDWMELNCETSGRWSTHTHSGHLGNLHLAPCSMWGEGARNSMRWQICNHFKYWSALNYDLTMST